MELSPKLRTAERHVPEKGSEEQKHKQRLFDVEYLCRFHFVVSPLFMTKAEVFPFVLFLFLLFIFLLLPIANQSLYQCHVRTYVLVRDRYLPVIKGPLWSG